MMERLREGVNSIAVKIILGLIILSFVFAGVGSYIVGGGANVAAKVGNVEIARGEFEQAYQNERNRMQSQLGDYFASLLADPAYAESFRKSVLDRMINDVLLEQHAESLGLRISDAQIRQMILDMPQFQNNGAFDQEIYQASLRRAGFSADSFAEYLRRDLVKNQLMMALQGSEFTLPSEVELQSKLLTQTRDIRTLTLPLSAFAENADITAEEIQQYYDENPAQFTRPEQVKVAYIELSAEALKGAVDISDDEIQQYYDEHLDKYSTAEQRSVSHILVQGDDEAKAQAILDQLNAGADFAALAQEKSEDIGSSEEGGSLGWIEKDVMDPAFEEAAFALSSVGDRTGLVKTDFGYHIIQLDALKASQSKPLSEVRAEIVAELSDQIAVDEFYSLQNELEKVAFEFPDSLDDAAQAVNLEIQTTDFVSALDAPELLKTPAVMQVLLSPEVKEDGLNSEVVEVAPEHVIVVRVDDVREQTVLPLTEVREQVEVQLAAAKGEQQALELGTQLVVELKDGKQDLLKSNNIAFGELETIDRNSPLAATAFAMVKPQAEQSTFAQSKDMEGNVVVIELTKVAANFDPAYNEQISAQMERVSTQQDLTAVLTVLRNNADIEYFVVEQ